eukprot:jgi/Mesvir1/9763/Mv12218-RA.1
MASNNSDKDNNRGTAPARRTSPRLSPEGSPSATVTPRVTPNVTFSTVVADHTRRRTPQVGAGARGLARGRSLAIGGSSAMAPGRQDSRARDTPIAGDGGRERSASSEEEGEVPPARSRTSIELSSQTPATSGNLSVGRQMAILDIDRYGAHVPPPVEFGRQPYLLPIGEDDIPAFISVNGWIIRQQFQLTADEQTHAIDVHRVQAMLEHRLRAQFNLIQVAVWIWCFANRPRHNPGTVDQWASRQRQRDALRVVAKQEIELTPLPAWPQVTPVGWGPERREAAATPTTVKRGAAVAPTTATGGVTTQDPLAGQRVQPQQPAPPPARGARWLRRPPGLQGPRR